MGSAVKIVLELYEALSASERVEVINTILEKSVPPVAAAAIAAPVTGGAVAKKRGWGGKRPPFWTKTVDSVDSSSVNAHGVEGQWGFDPSQTKPVLLGLAKPRHLYAVLKPTPGALDSVTDDDGFNVVVEGAEVVVASKEWPVIREKLLEMTRWSGLPYCEACLTWSKMLDSTGGGYDDWFS